MTRRLCWFRRDLRITDQAALSAALAQDADVEGVFVFDRSILDKLPRQDRRVDFIWHALRQLVSTWTASGRVFHLLSGEADQLIPRLAAQRQVNGVWTNHDDEPAARLRDERVAAALAVQGQRWVTFKDHVIFERDDILTAQGRPYSVFTPYRRAWQQRLTEAELAPHSVTITLRSCAPAPVPLGGDHWVCHPTHSPFPTLNELGFDASDLTTLPLPLGTEGAQRLLDDFAQRIHHYHERRDFPAIKGVSYLGAHLRFGTLSVRQLACLARAQPSTGADVFLSELAWRDFYHMVLAHRPDLAQGRCFLPRYDALTYPGDEDLFLSWCQARTGYPLVDAALRQLHHSGYMHNRLRMVSASFLTKDLQVDWRWGEQHFASHLLDFDLAANNGGWQWSASTGCDAQPWFRLFNPITQSERFDPQGTFIRRYLPELARCPDRHIHAPWRMPTSEWQRTCPDYWPPLVDHASARLATLARYRAVSTSGNEDKQVTK